MPDPVLAVYHHLRTGALTSTADAANRLRQALFAAQHPLPGDTPSTPVELSELRGLMERADALHSDLIRCINTRQLPRRKADQCRRKHAQGG